jgi:hypothetical protein
MPIALLRLRTVLLGPRTVLPNLTPRRYAGAVSTTLLPRTMSLLRHALDDLSQRRTGGFDFALRNGWSHFVLVAFGDSTPKAPLHRNGVVTAALESV